MDFKDLYRFVGPPMTRGPPSLPLIPSLLLPPVLPSPKLLPPALPRPPSSCSKKPHQQRVRLKPHHRLKPSQRQSNSLIRPQVKAVVGSYEGLKGNTREMQMMMSDLELEYRTAKKDWLGYVAADTRSLNPPGDSQAIWTTVLDICPQFLTLDPVVGEYF